MYDLKKVIESNTNEGVIDYEKVMATLDNEYVNPIVAKKTDKTKLTSEAVKEVITSLGIEGETVDDLKLYVKKMGGSTDEIKEENLKLSKELEKFKKDYESVLNEKSTIEQQIKENKQIELIKSLGVKDEKQIEFLKWDFNNQVTEEKDFDTVVKEYAKENKVKITTPIIKDDFGYREEGDLDISEAFEKLNRRK